MGDDELAEKIRAEYPWYQRLFAYSTIYRLEQEKQALQKDNSELREDNEDLINENQGIIDHYSQMAEEERKLEDVMASYERRFQTDPDFDGLGTIGKFMRIMKNGDKVNFRLKDEVKGLKRKIADMEEIITDCKEIQEDMPEHYVPYNLFRLMISASSHVLVYARPNLSIRDKSLGYCEWKDHQAPRLEHVFGESFEQYKLDVSNATFDEGHIEGTYQLGDSKEPHVVKTAKIGGELEEHHGYLIFFGKSEEKKPFSAALSRIGRLFKRKPENEDDFFMGDVGVIEAVKQIKELPEQDYS